jgi:pimeloyl-ACP methyl ester carboxylesterase
MKRGASIALGTAGALIGSKIYSDWRIRQAAARHALAGEFVLVDGARLHYRVHGSGQAIVLLHGTAMSLEDFDVFFEDSKLHGLRTIAFDRPGYGLSDWPAGEELTLELNVRLLDGALRELGIERPILVGHSLGGAVALRYAVEHPDRIKALTLIAPACYAEELDTLKLCYLTETPVLSQLFFETVYVPMMELLAPVFLGRIFAPEAIPPGYVNRMKPVFIEPRHMRAFADEVKHLPEGLATQSRYYREIRVPVAILAGTGDRITHTQSQAVRLAHEIPHARLTLLEGAGHMLHHHRPEAVISAVHDLEFEAIVRT